MVNSPQPRIPWRESLREGLSTMELVDVSTEYHHSLDRGENWGCSELYKSGEIELITKLIN